ncbi:MAG: hypothetical protein M3173_09075, partial [Chloroflexota bacterium]|nr:hypothetical protein [Chloroflexota bacterium]
MRLPDRLVVERPRLKRGAIAGLAGGAAFAAFMKADMAITGERVDDFQLLAGYGPFRDNWTVPGTTVHMTNSVILGAAYSTVEPLLPGPGWCRGLIFALIENTLLYPFVALLDLIHPAIRSGDLPRYSRPWPFTAETLRHVAYGLVLGYVFD